MSLTKWEPLNDIEAMVDRAFNWPAIRLGASMALSDWAPRVDIRESDGTYLLEADLPGLRKEDISISVSGDTLTIQGERKRESEEKKAHFHRIERSYGSFSRSFSLPPDANLQDIQAHCEDGQLSISIHKKAGSAAPEARRVPID